MKILMINVPYAGHTNPTLPLTRELVQRGHQVCYINAEEFRNKIEATGASFIPYINYPEKPSEQQKKRKCFRAAFDTALSLKEDFDILIYEMFFYPGKKLAQRMNIPCVRQFSQPAWSEQMMASASRMFKLSCKLIDMQVMGKKNVAYMQLENKTLMDAVLWDKPNLNIVYVSEIFQNQRESFGEDYLFATPLQQTEMVDINIPYAEMKSPIIYISLGSIISNRGFCKKCIRAFGGKDVSVILNTGKIAPESLGKIPDNIYTYSFVPQVEVLQHADVFITHCGMNSVNEAMAAGVPMVAMPFINDQIANAERVVQMGIGKRVRSFPSRGRELYHTTMEILRDKEMQKKSKEVQKMVKKENAFEAVIERIQEITSF